MSRAFRAPILLLLLASCGGGRFSAPHNMDDACSIIDQRPHYLDAFAETEARWGVPVEVQMATIWQESKFIGNAKTPHRYILGIIPMGRVSSAYGYAQALDGTWEEYEDEEGGSRARRDDIDDAADFMGWYMYESYQKLGIPLTDAENQYLAYHEGRTGYAGGSHQRKPWLMDIAENVGARSEMYGAQLASCR
jgi:hypothetical protein